MNTDEDPEIEHLQLEPGQIDDGVISGILQRYRGFGYDSFLMPQNEKLPTTDNQAVGGLGAASRAFHGTSCRPQSHRQVARSVRMDRREIDDELACAGCGCKTFGPEDHLFHGCSIRHAHEDDVRPR